MMQIKRSNLMKPIFPFGMCPLINLYFMQPFTVMNFHRHIGCPVGVRQPGNLNGIFSRFRQFSEKFGRRLSIADVTIVLVTPLVATVNRRLLPVSSEPGFGIGRICHQDLFARNSESDHQLPTWF